MDNPNKSTPVKDERYSLIPCYFGAHRYEIYKEELVSNVNGTTIGKVIISRCSVCGKIKTDNVKLLNAY